MMVIFPVSIFRLAQNVFLISLLIVTGVVVASQAAAQTCYSGATWQGPSANPVTLNRTKPVYTSCTGIQDIDSNLDIDTSDNTTGGVHISHDGTNRYPAIQATLTAGVLAGVFGDDLYVSYSNTGKTVRIQDFSNNPELQLQYGSADSSFHWSLYVDQSADDFRLWGNGDNRITVLQSGFVGIGTEFDTTPPAELLQIRNNSGNAGMSVIADGSDDASLRLVESGTSGFELLYDGGANRLDIGGGTSGIFSTALSIYRDSGLVGINDTTPTAQLDIDGDIQINDGTAQIGYVLTAQDAEGTAAWTDITTIPGSSHWVLSGTDLYASTTSWDVAVGTDSPHANAKFQVTDTDGDWAGYFRQEGTAAGDIAVFAYNGTSLPSPGVNAAILAMGSSNDYGMYETGSTRNAFWSPTAFGWGDPGTAQLYVNGNTGLGDNQPEELLTVADPAGPRILLKREDTSTVANDWLGQIMFDSTDASGVSSVDASAIIRAVASENHGDGDKGAHLIFLTKPSNTDEDAAAVEHMRIDEGGQIGIGVTSPGNPLDIESDSDNQAIRIRENGSTESWRLGVNSDGDFLLYDSGTGSGNERIRIEDNYSSGTGLVSILATDPLGYELYVNGTSSAVGGWFTGSDSRFKKDIEPLHGVMGKLQQVQPVSYYWRTDEFPEKNFEDDRQFGLIAQEVERVFPEFVTTDSSGYKAIQYDKLSTVLWQAVLEQQQEIDGLEERLKKVEKILTTLYTE